MSRDGSGNFSLVAGNPVVTGTTITVTWANTTLSDISSALTGSVARDGQAAMTGPLNMGANAITSATTIAASGAVTAASLIPTSATVPANGLYLSAANTLGFATNSVNRATLDASGNLVITGNFTAGGSITAVGATLTGTILLGGVNVTDFARLSQNNTFSNAAAGTASLTLTNTDTGATSNTRLGATNSTRSTYLFRTSTGYSGVFLTSGPSGEQGGINSFGAFPFSIAVNDTVGYTMDSSRNHDFKAGTVTTNNSSASEVGYKGLPRTTSAPNPGECRAISAGVTINTGLVAGQFYSYYNDSAAQVTLTKGTVTNLRLAGTTSDGNRTIEARGMATIWANSATEFIVSGPGVG